LARILAHDLGSLNFLDDDQGTFGSGVFHAPTPHKEKDGTSASDHMMCPASINNLIANFRDSCEMDLFAIILCLDYITNLTVDSVM
jgi:hypothetical protein